MVLVKRLAVDNRLDGCAIIVHARVLETLGKLGVVAVLTHVEVEPGILVKSSAEPRPPRGWNVSRWPHRRFAQPTPPWRGSPLLPIIFYVAIAAQDPDQTLVR